MFATSIWHLATISAVYIFIDIYFFPCLFYVFVYVYIVFFTVIFVPVFCMILLCLSSLFIFLIPSCVSLSTWVFPALFHFYCMKLIAYAVPCVCTCH